MVCTVSFVDGTYNSVPKSAVIKDFNDDDEEVMIDDINGCYCSVIVRLLLLLLWIIFYCCCFLLRYSDQCDDGLGSGSFAITHDRVEDPVIGRKNGKSKSQNFPHELRRSPFGFLRWMSNASHFDLYILFLHGYQIESKKDIQTLFSAQKSKEGTKEGTKKKFGDEIS
jgi:hypothetical protein